MWRSRMLSDFSPESLLDKSIMLATPKKKKEMKELMWRSGMLLDFFSKLHLGIEGKVLGYGGQGCCVRLFFQILSGYWKKKSLNMAVRDAVSDFSSESHLSTEGKRSTRQSKMLFRLFSWITFKRLKKKVSAAVKNAIWLSFRIAFRQTYLD